MSSRSDTDGRRSMSGAWETHVIVLPGDAASWTTLAASWITEQRHVRPTLTPTEDTE